MKALVCKAYAPLEALSFDEIDAPPLQSGCVRIDMKVASVNPPDALMPQGRYQVKPLVPFVPGVEGMGLVSEIADNVEGFRIGERVMTYAGHGCYARQLVVDAIRVKRVPEDMSDEIASGFILVYSTAYHGLVDCGRLREGETLVVLGAAGGIGLCAIQIAKSIGARVIAVASTDEKLRRCKENGADACINITTQPLTETIREMTGGKGADVIWDVVGADVTERALRAIAPYGRLLIAGYASGTIPVIKGNLVLLKQAQVIGVSYRLFLERTPEAAARNLDALCRMWERGDLKPLVSEHFDFDHVVDAIRLVGAGKVIGKVAVALA
jgi:NADPH2:quinone reductase